MINQGNTRTENGSCLMQAFRSPPPGPGGFTFSMFGLKEKCLTPNLKGDNGVEITLEGYTHETNYPKGLDENILRGHIMLLLRVGAAKSESRKIRDTTEVCNFILIGWVRKGSISPSLGSLCRKTSKRTPTITCGDQHLKHFARSRTS